MVKGAYSLGCGLAAEVVRRFGAVRLRVTGGSMTPAVRPGDTILVQRCGMAEISTGEIVLFARYGRLFAHRVTGNVTRSGEGCLLTRGDRLRMADPAVSRSELLGRVSRIERKEETIYPSVQRSLAQRMISRILSYSDRATSLYLRFAP